MELTKKNANLLFVVLIIVVLGFIVFASYYMISNKQAFTENPFIYGAKKLNLNNCYCTCQGNSGIASQTYLYFNQTSFAS